jgi:hypothetical protein
MLTRIRRLIVHRQPVVNNLSRGPWLKRSPTGAVEPEVPVRMYSYDAPPTGVAPAAGEIIHADNLLNKLAISHTDLDGNDITAGLAQLGSGDFVSVGGKTFNIIAPIVADGSGTFSYVTVEPEEQLQPAVYPVSAWKGVQ